MYAEYDEAPGKEYEFTVTFEPSEAEAYAWYLQQEHQVWQEKTWAEATQGGVWWPKGSGFQLQIGVLQPSSGQASLHQGGQEEGARTGVRALALQWVWEGMQGNRE